MCKRETKVGIIIHGAATAAATAGAGLAQLPGSDNLVIVPIQTAMIISIGHEHGQVLTKVMALSVLSSASAGIVGRSVSQVLVGWIPGWGNAINASTAFTITEAIGWAASVILAEEDAVYGKVNSGRSHV